MGLLIFDVSLHEKIGSLQDILRVKEKRRYRRQREKIADQRRSQNEDHNPNAGKFRSKKRDSHSENVAFGHYQ